VKNPSPLPIILCLFDPSQFMPTTFQYSLKDVRPSMMFFLTIRLGEKKLDFYP